LHNALALIAGEQCGVLIYLRGHEGRGIGLGHKIRAYALQDDEGLDTVDANTAQGLPVDARDYAVGVAILADLGLSTVRTLTNNPAKVEALRAGGFVVAEQISLQIDATPANSKYLSTKRDRMGHRLT
jgi:3,4-dihydroxy 2-butanone 4-phosphate synthase/GTP cyclohydrolase II